MTTVIENPTREAWLETRKSGIGASESAAALGFSPYKSPYQLWAEKTGAVEPDDLSKVRHVRLGNKLEPIIAEEFEIETGRTATLWPQHQMVRHSDIPWLTCTPDATQICPERGPGVLQMKAPGLRQLKNWKSIEDVPLIYQIQLQHEMAVVGANWGSLCALVGGQELEYHDFEFNARFVEAMIPKLAEFWAAVQTKQAPPVDGSESCTETIRKLFPHEMTDFVVLPDEALAWDRELNDVKFQISELTEKKNLLENQLKAAIGAASEGRLPDGSRYTYKQQVRKSHVVAASEFRVLRRSAK